MQVLTFQPTGSKQPVSSVDLLRCQSSTHHQPFSEVIFAYLGLARRRWTNHLLEIKFSPSSPLIWCLIKQKSAIRNPTLVHYSPNFSSTMSHGKGDTIERRILDFWWNLECLTGEYYIILVNKEICKQHSCFSLIILFRTLWTTMEQLSDSYRAIGALEYKSSRDDTPPFHIFVSQNLQLTFAIHISYNHILYNQYSKLLPSRPLW